MMETTVVLKPEQQWRRVGVTEMHGVRSDPPDGAEQCDPRTISPLVEVLLGGVGQARATLEGAEIVRDAVVAVPSEPREANQLELRESGRQGTEGSVLADFRDLAPLRPSVARRRQRTHAARGSRSTARAKSPVVS